MQKYKTRNDVDINNKGYLGITNDDEFHDWASLAR